MGFGVVKLQITYYWLTFLIMSGDTLYIFNTPGLGIKVEEST